MAAFRKVKHSNYTVIDNCIFHDYRLSAKAKGILLQLLSLPDNWNYSISGITSLFSDGESSIRSGLEELKELGYLKVNRLTDSKGKVVDWEYIIYENPNYEYEGKPYSGKPVVENPHVENPDVENYAQLNTYISNTDISNKDIYKETISKDISKKDVENDDGQKNQTPNSEKLESETSSMCTKVSPPKTKKSIPTQEEVVEYCKTNNLLVDPYYFFSYYSNQSWRDASGKPVKNWKNKMNTWHAKEAAKRYSSEKKSDSNYDDEAKRKIAEKLKKALEWYPWCKSLDDFIVTEQYGEYYLMPHFTEDGRELDRRGIPLDGKPI